MLEIIAAKEQYGVLLIDMQERFLDKFRDSKKKNLIKRQIRLLKYSRISDLPLVALEFAELGGTIQELRDHINLLKRHAYIVKDGNNGFFEDRLIEQLMYWRITNLILTGVNTSACVRDTAEGALKHDFCVTYIDDLVADFESGNHKYFGWFLNNCLCFDRYDDFFQSKLLNQRTFKKI